MSAKVVPLEGFSLWCSEVADLNLTFHSSRKRAWDNLVALTKVETKAGEQELKIHLKDYLSLKSFLTLRSEAISDAARLAFDVLLDRLAEESTRLTLVETDQLPLSLSSEQKEENPLAST